MVTVWDNTSLELEPSLHPTPGMWGDYSPPGGVEPALENIDMRGQNAPYLLSQSTNVK